MILAGHFSALGQGDAIYMPPFLQSCTSYELPPHFEYPDMSKEVSKPTATYNYG